MTATKRSSKASSTLLAQACSNVQGFSDMYRRLKRRMSTSGRSTSTLHNYARHLSQMALHFNCLPTDLEDEQIEDYLYLLQQRHNTPSESYFKHTVYGLRFLFRLEGLDDKRVALPAIERQEMKQLLKAPSLLKHRILIALLYDCGLRCLEVRTLTIKDVDLDRRMVHVRQSKGKKDRYVPMGKVLSKVFRARFVAALRKALPDESKAFFESLFRTQWVVYAKRPFGGPEQVIEYLGRYTHKIAISNHRFCEMDGERVVFYYKDYRHGGVKKRMPLEALEFIRRFAIHILP